MDKIDSAILIANRAKYFDGEILAEWLSVPFEKSELKTIFEIIGLNDSYSEYIILEYQNIPFNLSENVELSYINEISYYIQDIYNKINDYEINSHALPNRKSDLEWSEEVLGEYVLTLEENGETKEDIIERINNLQIFTYTSYSDLSPLEQFGFYLLEEMNYLDYINLSDDVKQYINVEKFAFDVILNGAEVYVSRSTEKNEKEISVIIM
ncbi:antirestriction protein ArdA [Staphylococcus nepalensis]|uniref:antirestriction protein ArdA n=1 Tax=Staphylococcus TaxID=1279 RepID=UPI002DBC1607|nr:antirestriction protein ArdA [Staphylococcus pseudoxylosus]MEB6038052.1 antirestriction protein ArdA [Staphylococcus pseudoxylosus]